MVVLQVGTALDAASALLLVSLVALYAVSLALDTGWWNGLWVRISRQFDRLRETHWLLPAVAVALGLTAYDVIAAELDGGLPTLVCWFVLAGYASWLFVRQRLFARLHRRRLQKSARSNRDHEGAEAESAEGLSSSGRLR